MYLPEYPCHVVQRGNNREACYIEPENYQLYLELWQECSKRSGVLLHACCLMTNHIHHIATPQHASSISNTMKVVGSRYAQYINKRYYRTGTLWEGRHKSSLVQSDRYFLVCSRYIELNPVAANMVKRPDAYPWSSYIDNAWGDRSWLTAHDEYFRLGSTIETRARRYRELFKHQIDDVDICLIRRSSHYCHPVSDDRFRREIERKYGIRFGQTKRGRPGKTFNV